MCDKTPNKEEVSSYSRVSSSLPSCLSSIVVSLSSIMSFPLLGNPIEGWAVDCDAVGFRAVVANVWVSNKKQFVAAIARRVGFLYCECKTLVRHHMCGRQLQ